MEEVVIMIWSFITKTLLVGCIVLVGRRMAQSSFYHKKIHWYIVGQALLLFALTIRLLISWQPLHWTSGLLYLGLFILLVGDMRVTWATKVKDYREIESEGRRIHQ